MGMDFNFIAKRRWAPRRVAAEMAAARARGAGAYLKDWSYGSAKGSATASADAIVEPIVQWCRETLSETRRPWGIDLFDLVIAVRRGDGEAESLALERRAPTELYGREPLARTLQRFLHGDSNEPIRHVSIALFSWGDAAHAALAPNSS